MKQDTIFEGRMKQFVFTILITLLVINNVAAQPEPGFYTGQLKSSYSKEPFNVQFDLMKEGNNYTGVLRLRITENMQLMGCDSWYEGRWVGNSLEMKRRVVLKGSGFSRGDCAAFGSFKLTPKKGDPREATIYTGNMLYDEGSNLGKITMSLIDTVNSFSVDDEKEEAIYRISEEKIGMARTDSARIKSMLEGRGIEWVDSLTITRDTFYLKVEAPEADFFHRLTILADSQVLVLNATPRQKGARIIFKGIETDQIDLLFLCYHVLVDAAFRVKLTITYKEEEKVMEVPVSTYRNYGVRIFLKSP